MTLKVVLLKHRWQSFERMFSSFSPFLTMFLRFQCLAWIVSTIAILEASKSDCEQNYPYCISSKEMETMCKGYRNLAEERNELEIRLAEQGRVIKPNERVPDLGQFRRKSTDPMVRLDELRQLKFLAITDKLIKKYNLTRVQIDEVLSVASLDGPNCRKATEDCQKDSLNIVCSPQSKYRTQNGTCNNLRNPTWGSAGICFKRLLPALYSGSSGPRQSVLGGPLPAPRDLSVDVHNNLNRTTNQFSHMYMFYGQLLDHDIGQTPQSTTVENLLIQCCPNYNNSTDTHPQCSAITMRPDDPFFSGFLMTCMNFVRSAPCRTCALGTREHINQITAYIDGSFVYGTNVNTTNILRANDGTGKLRVDTTPYGALPPSKYDPENNACSALNTSDMCFQTGDSRANQHTTLTSLQTLFLREHNRLATGLKQINPNWDDERLFQEARRILGAEMQVITYKEYLPITLGKDRMSDFELWISNGKMRTGYDENVDSSLYTEFSTAAFRFGHSLINTVLSQRLRNSDGGLILMKDTYFATHELEKGRVDDFLKAGTESPAQKFDRHLVPDVTDFLYNGGPPNTPGLDLAAININRGRDHGLPTYVDMVRSCFCIDIQGFKDLVSDNFMTECNMQLLKFNYRHVDDIDLWTGILNEIPIDGAAIGPTGACIIGQQFNKLKFGDRFYFEHQDQVGSFTDQQLEKLRNVTLSSIMCLNTEIIEVSRNAMLHRSKNNPSIECRSVLGINLNEWKE